MSTPRPPAWYPDPTNASMLRWWDGQRWTDHLYSLERPVASPYTQRPGTATGSNAAKRRRRRR